jgi:hypothetical protein
MSFDIDIESADGETLYSTNLTHNVNEIVDRCLVDGGATRAVTSGSCYDTRSWGRLNGWRAGDVIQILKAALQEANNTDRAAEFQALEPTHKWGSLDAVQRTLAAVLHACGNNPDGVIRTDG